MGIDWFTFIAQVVNFLVLVALLRFFLYDRIIKAMDAREARIRERLEEAERKRKEAEEEALALNEKNREFELQRRDMLARVEDEVEERRREMTGRARGEVERAREQWHQSLRHQKATFLRELRRRAGSQVLETARRALADLADAELEYAVARVFLRRLDELDEGQRRDLAESIRKADYRVDVVSAFDLPESVREEIIEQVGRIVDDEIELDYKVSPDILGGIELRAQSRKLAWNVDDYLERLEVDLSQMVDAEAETLSEVAAEGTTNE